jgi:hypothetical protein
VRCRQDPTLPITDLLGGGLRTISAASLSPKISADSGRQRCKLYKPIDDVEWTVNTPDLLHATPKAAGVNEKTDNAQDV